MRQYQRGAVSSCLHPLTSPTLVPFWGLMVNKNQNRTPILESNWGLGALNQGNSLPFLPQTPHGLRAPPALPFHH